MTATFFAVIAGLAIADGERGAAAHLLHERPTRDSTPELRPIPIEQDAVSHGPGGALMARPPVAPRSSVRTCLAPDPVYGWHTSANIQKRASMPDESAEGQVAPSGGPLRMPRRLLA